MAMIENLDEFLLQLMDGEPRPSPGKQHSYELRVAPDVFRALTGAADAATADALPQGISPRPVFGVAPCTVTTDLATGEYELLRDGAVRKTGSIGTPDTQA